MSSLHSKRILARILYVTAAIASLVLACWYYYAYAYSRPKSISTGYYVDRMSAYVISISDYDKDQYVITAKTPWIKGPPDYRFSSPKVYGCYSLGEFYSDVELELKYANAEMLGGDMPMSSWLQFTPGIMLETSGSTITDVIAADSMVKGVLGSAMGFPQRSLFQKLLLLNYTAFSYRDFKLESPIEISNVLVAKKNTDLYVKRGYTYYLIQDDNLFKTDWRERGLGLDYPGFEKYYVVTSADVQR
jgi:hypothetical protein